MADTLNTSAHSKQAVRARCPGSLVFDRRTLLVAALGAGMAGTAKADARLITIEGIGTARLHTAPAARAVLAMVPGFGCAARRYDWLSGLNARGVTVVIPELADIDGLKGMQSLFGHLRSYGLPDHCRWMRWKPTPRVTTGSPVPKAIGRRRTSKA